MGEKNKHMNWQTENIFVKLSNSETSNKLVCELCDLNCGRKIETQTWVVREKSNTKENVSCKICQIQVCVVDWLIFLVKTRFFLIR